MSGPDHAGETQAEPDPMLVEAIAKQIFRSENPADVLWDTKLFERAGRPLDGLKVASPEAKDDCLRRARQTLLDAS